MAKKNDKKEGLVKEAEERAAEMGYGPPTESLEGIKEEVTTRMEPEPEEKPKRKRRKKKEPEPEPIVPAVEPELMNYFVLALTGFIATFLGEKWKAEPHELPMLSQASNRWITAKFPDIMEKHSADVEMITAWGLYALNRINLSVPEKEEMVPTDEALDALKPGKEDKSGGIK